MPLQPTRYRTRRQVSSGGVITRQARGHPQVCLIARRQDGQRIWGLPKGHVEAGEDPLDAAVREVREETGLVGKPLTKLGAISYWFAVNPALSRKGGVKRERVRYFKRVHFYLLTYLKGSTRAHDHEVEHAAWLPLSKALARISYENERKILRKAQRYLTHG